MALRLIKGGAVGSLFLSYDRDDRGRASAVASALEKAGHSVWWDRHIKGGAQFSKQIEAALGRAEVVVVLWSRHAVESAWVRDEAASARDSGRLVPATLDGTPPPLGFRQFHTVDLSRWTGRGRRALVELIDAIHAALGEDHVPSEPQRGAGPPATVRKVAIAVAAALALAVAIAVAGWLTGWRPWGAAGQPRITMAVLPFDAIPADQENAPFAEGLAEEISGELARNPRLQMIGRTSAAMFEESRADAKTIGRKLRVTYLLDGSVRRIGTDVRVGVELVRARDGAQVWRHTYNGTLNDIFAIQDRIGQSVEAQLRSSFVGKEGVTARSLATRGDVYSHYLTARGILREPGKFSGSRKESIERATELLRQAVALDPNYAPAWAQLSGAILVRREVAGFFRTAEERARSRNEAIVYANRALALAPRLAEAHYAKARTLVGPEGRQEGNLRGLETAVRLDPNSADAWFSLANYHAWNGDFEAELKARRKAVALEPLWIFAFGPAAQSAWNLGFEEEARRYWGRVERDGVPSPFQAHAVRSDVAARNGDWSLQLIEGLAARRAADQGRRSMAEAAIGEALRSAGDQARAKRAWATFGLDEMTWALWRGQPPSQAELSSRSRNLAAFWGNRELIPPLLKNLVNHGRSREVVDLYRRQFGAPEKLQRYPGGHVPFVSDATTIALALRDVGMNEEAGHLLTLVRESVDQRIRGGRAPRSYYFHAALVAAAQRDNGAALRWLEHASANKWWYAQEYSLPDIADEPAFRNLKADPRFQAIAARQRAWQARERREMGPLLREVDSL